MNFKTLVIFSAALLLVALSSASAQNVPYPEGAKQVVQPIVHDPVIIEDDGVFYMFHTGPGITSWRSTDLEKWDTIDPVFPVLPSWMKETIPEFTGHLWAPDISYYNGQFYLYYSVSAFGKNTSCIGVATNKTLNPESPDYRWIDHGIVLQSYPGMTNWNAIDPAIIEDEEGQAYMSFGSFWGGLFIAELSEDRLSLSEDWQNLQVIASRSVVPASFPTDGYETEPGNGAIEAPFIFKHEDFYYLFASIDYCCRGPESTYKMIVGRSKDIRGPYLDSKGVSMVDGGGDIILAGDERWYGLGHNQVVHLKGQDYIVFHSYDSRDSAGRAVLRIEPLQWDDPVPQVLVQAQ